MPSLPYPDVFWIGERRRSLATAKTGPGGFPAPWRGRGPVQRDVSWQYSCLFGVPNCVKR